MGAIADTHRSTLRQLAQASDRLYRGLAEGLSDSTTIIEEPRALIQPEGGAPATEAQLLDLKNDALQELCAQRGITVPKRPRKDLMVTLLLVDPNGPPPLSLLSPPTTKPTAGGKGTGGKAVEEGNSPQHRLPPALPECSRGGGTKPCAKGAAGPVRCGARR